MDINKISNEIATLKRAVKTAATASLKAKLKNKIVSLNEVLKDANIPAKRLAMILLGAKRKVFSYTTAEFNAVIKRLSYKAEYSFLKGLTKPEIKDDLERYAKNPGWRFKGRGNYKTPTKKDLAADAGLPYSKRRTYYEKRSNRSDVTNPAKLKDGGNIKMNEIGFNIQEVTKSLSSNEKNQLIKLSNNVVEKAKKKGFSLYVNLREFKKGAEIEIVIKHNHRNIEGKPEYNFMNEFEYKIERGVRITDDLTFDVTTGSYEDSWDENTISIDKYFSIIENAKLKDGGGVESENKEMVLNNAQQIEHHAEELENAAKNSKHVPAWVVAKIYNASSNISDATHYLEGVNTMPKEQFERIHEEVENYKMETGGGLDSFLGKQMHVSKVCKTHGCSTKDYLHAKKKYKTGGIIDINELNLPVIRTQFEDEEYEFKEGGKIKNTLQIKKGDKIVVYKKHEGIITNILKTKSGTISYKWKMNTAPNDDQFRLYEFDYGKRWVLKKDKMEDGGEVEEEEEMDWNKLSDVQEELGKLYKWKNQYGSKGADGKIKQLEERIEYLKTNNIYSNGGGVGDTYNIKNIKIGDRIKDKYNNEAEVWYNDGEKIEAEYISGASYVYRQKDFDNGEVRFLWANKKNGGAVGDNQLNVVFSRQDVFEKAKDFYENESAFYPSDVNNEFKTFVFDIENGEADATEFYLDQELQETDLDGYYFEIADKMKQGGAVKGAKFKHHGKELEIQKVQDGAVYTTDGKQYSLKVLESLGVTFNKERAKSNKPRGVRGNKREQMEGDVAELEYDLKGYKQDLRQLNFDMELEAGEKGNNWSDADANRYGREMNELEEKIKSLKKQIAEKEQKLSYKKGGEVRSKLTGWKHKKNN